MSVKKRKELVFRKRRCFQCLDGQTGWRETDHKWKCTNRWICRNDSHNNFDKLHFLICVHHVDDPQNREMYEEFKKEVLISEWQKKLASSIYICRALSSGMNAKQIECRPKEMCSVKPAKE